MVMVLRFKVIFLHYNAHSPTQAIFIGIPWGCGHLALMQTLSSKQYSARALLQALALNIQNH
jgi:hypothetical protein